MLLSTKNLSLKMPGANKLLPKFVGPFLLVQVVNDVAYKLELPECMKVHNVFHVSLLKLYHPDPNGTPPPPPEVVDGAFEFTVDRVLNHRDKRVGRRSVREYLIRWLWYGPEHDTWEPLDNMHNALESITEYWTVVDAASKPTPEPATSTGKRRSARVRARGLTD